MFDTRTEEEYNKEHIAGSAGCSDVNYYLFYFK